MTREDYYEDEDVTIKIDYMPDPYLHVQVRTWGVEVLKKKYYPLTHQLYAYLKGKGFEYVYATSYEHEKKIQKFQNMFGMAYLARIENIVVTRRKL